MSDSSAPVSPRGFTMGSRRTGGAPSSPPPERSPPRASAERQPTHNRFERASSMNDARKSDTPLPIPPPSPKSKHTFAVARESYEGEGAGDISFTKGDRIILVKAKPGDEVWVGKTEFGDEGNFPASSVVVSDGGQHVPHPMSRQSSLQDLSPRAGGSGTSSPSANSLTSSPVSARPGIFKKKGQALKEKVAETLRSKASSVASTAQAFTKSAKDVGGKALQMGKGMIARAAATEKKPKEEASKEMTTAHHLVYEDLLKERSDLTAYFRVLLNDIMRPTAELLIGKIKEEERSRAVTVTLGRNLVLLDGNPSEDVMQRLYLHFLDSFGLRKTVSDVDDMDNWAEDRQEEFREAMSKFAKLALQMRALGNPSVSVDKNLQILLMLRNSHLLQGYALKPPYSSIMWSTLLTPFVAQANLVLRNGGLGSSTVFTTQPDEDQVTALRDAFQIGDTGTLEQANCDVVAWMLLEDVMRLDPPLFPAPEEASRVGGDWNKAEELLASLHSQEYLDLLVFLSSFFRQFRHVSIVSILMQNLFPTCSQEHLTLVEDFIAIVLQNMPSHFVRDSAVGYRVIVTSRSTKKVAKGRIVGFEREKNRYIVRLGNGSEVAVKDSPETLEWVGKGSEGEDMPLLMQCFLGPLVAYSEPLLISPFHVLEEFYETPENSTAFEKDFLEGPVCKALLRQLGGDKARKHCVLGTSKHMIEMFLFRGMENVFLDQVVFEFMQEEVNDNTATLGTLFRGNSTASRIVSAFIDTVGHSMLKRCLSTPLCELIVADADRVHELEVQQNALHNSGDRGSNGNGNGAATAAEGETEKEIPFSFVADHARAILDAIIAFGDELPASIRKCCQLCAQIVGEKFVEDEALSRLIAVGNLLFLRFFVPALYNPVDAGLLPAGTAVTPSVQKILKLVTGAIQCLANQTSFSAGKPSSALNELFIEPERERVVEFLENVSAVPSEVPSASVSLELYHHAFTSVVLTTYLINPEVLKLKG